jgi:Holliday junction resolvasome RuvABC endonuclease subunit
MGLITAMNTQRAYTVMGIDSSTNSLAFAVFKKEELVKYGKIYFTGSTSYERLADSQKKIIALASDFDVDYIAIEKAIMVRSTGVAIKLGMAVGVIIASVLKPGTKVVEVAPITWQAFIGNTNYSAKKKGEVKKAYPGKSASWYRNHIREERKQYTIDYFNKKFGLDNDDNDVSDAMGIAWFAVHHGSQ